MIRNRHGSVIQPPNSDREIPVTELPTIFSHFQGLDDPRVDRTKLHKLIDILVIAVCATICGAETWEDIEEYGNTKQEWLTTFLELPAGIPSHDTFARLFAALDPDSFRRCFLSWIQAVSETIAGDSIAIDGKTLRRSFDRGRGKAAIHMISAWSSAQRLVLGQLKVDDKTNEITAIPDLLDMLSLKGCIVTIDAMGCQKNIAEKIVAAEGDYVLALKGNHGRIHDSVKLAFDGATPDLLTRRSQDHWMSTDADHGRIETRRVWVVTDLDWLEEKSGWKGFQSVGIVDSTVEAAGKVTHERRFFISSLVCCAKDFAVAVRNHWGVESSLHWTLDVTFREDACRIRRGHAPENFAMLRHISLNLLQSTKTKRLSIKTKRLRAGWDNGYLLQVLVGIKNSRP